MAPIVSAFSSFFVYTSPPSPKSPVDLRVLSGLLSMDNEDDVDSFAKMMSSLYNGELLVDQAFKV